MKRSLYNIDTEWGIVKFRRSVRTSRWNDIPEKNKTWIRNQVNKIQKILIPNIPVFNVTVYPKGWTIEKKYLNGKDTKDDNKYK